MPDLEKIKKVDLERALKIEGWMAWAELAWLGVQAQSRSRIVEVGSWLGRSTRALADNTPGIVVSVDLWHGTGLLREDCAWSEEAWLNKIIEDVGGVEGIWPKFHENVKDLLGSKILPIRAASADVAECFQTQLFDMAFIDGDHSYDAAKKDIQLWSQRLVNGGLLCGHDYSHEYKDHVIRAVDELVPERQIVEGTSIWFDYVYWRNTDIGTA